jgi:hypothetical protein
MTIEEFNMFVDELDNICERYGANIEFVAGTYEPIDVKVHISTVIDEEVDNE